MDVLTDIPAWLIGLGLVGIALLMVWSISKGTPFLIAGKKWGVDGPPEGSRLSRASESQAELATRLKAQEERPVPEATEVDPLVTTKLGLLNKELASIRSQLQLDVPSAQEALQAEVEKAVSQLNVSELAASVENLATEVVERAADTGSVQANIVTRLEALERKQSEMAEQLSQLASPAQANPESSSGSNSGDQRLLDIRRLNLKWEVIDSFDYEIWYTKDGSAMVSEVERLMLSAGVTKKPRRQLILESYFSGEFDSLVAMQFNALHDQSAEAKRAWVTILTFLEFPLGDMIFPHAKDVKAGTLRWCLQ